MTNLEKPVRVTSPPFSIALVVFGPTAPTREIVAALLTPEELEDARKRARDWHDAFEKRDHAGE